MHKRILEDANIEQLKNYIDWSLKRVREFDYEMYEDLEEELYEQVYGNHFTEWKLKEAVSQLVNEDGSIGAHWNVEETSQVAKQDDIAFRYFNKYDWNYVMNMIYSDYYGAVPNEVQSYVKLAKKFICDKDGKEGKAYSYYKMIKK